MKKIFVYTLVICLIVTGFCVEPVSAAKPKLNYSFYKMSGGMTVKLKVLRTKKKVKWSSSKKSIAKVSSKGKVTGLKKGKCYIIAKVGKKKLKCKITVTSNAAPSHKPFTSATLDAFTVKINLKDTCYKTGTTPSFANSNGKFVLALKNNKNKVSWSSSDKGVATVSKGTITAVSVGNCTITAKVKKKKYKCKVYVTNIADSKKAFVQKSIYQMYKMINDTRINAKVAPLKIDDKLMLAADIRAKEIIPETIVPLEKGIMLDSNMSHQRPTGASYTSAFTQVNLPLGAFMGENISYYADFATMMDEFLVKSHSALMNSSKHKENILSKDYTHIGIGYNMDTVYKNLGNRDCIASFWSQLFYTYL